MLSTYFTRKAMLLGALRGVTGANQGQTETETGHRHVMYTYGKYLLWCHVRLHAVLGCGVAHYLLLTARPHTQEFTPDNNSLHIHHETESHKLPIRGRSLLDMGAPLFEVPADSGVVLLRQCDDNTPQSC
jgi:hypothetical protein